MAAIEPGVDFVEAIDRAVGSCVVLLVIIGKQWLSCHDATGRNRLDAPKDFSAWKLPRHFGAISGSSRCWRRVRPCQARMICPTT